MFTCPCPTDAALPDIPCVKCPERFGQIQRVIFQRVKADNKMLLSEVDNIAEWQRYLTANDDTKIVVSPYIYSPTQESGAPRTFGGGNDSLNGVEEIIGREPSTFTGSLRNVPQYIIAIIKAIQCEDVGVYLIDENGNIEGLYEVDNDNNEWLKPIPIKALFIGDKVHGGIERPDTNVIQWTFNANYSDDLRIIPIKSFSILTDLCVTSHETYAHIPNVESVRRFITSNTSSIIFDYSDSQSTSGYSHLGYVDAANLINVWARNNDIMFLSEFEIFAPYDCKGMFKHYSVSRIEFVNFNTSNTAYFTEMFDSCVNLTEINISLFNTAKAINMGRMFANCESITSLNLSAFNTARVIIMQGMFSGCTNLEMLDVSSFSVSKVTDMQYMFASCQNLRSLNLSNFNTSSARNMKAMFANCTSLQSLNLSNFNTLIVVDFSEMFINCATISSLDLSTFNTSNASFLYDMFRDCANLTTLNLARFRTPRVLDVQTMFANCRRLTTIYTRNDWSLTNAEDNEMFVNCIRLVGGNGTTYSSSHIGSEYAKIDRVGTPGYFTQI